MLGHVRCWTDYLASYDMCCIRHSETSMKSHRGLVKVMDVAKQITCAYVSYLCGGMVRGGGGGGGGIGVWAGQLNEHVHTLSLL